MNLIQQQADDFYLYNFSEGEDYKKFITVLKYELDEYNKIPHKFEFIERILFRIRADYDEHLKTCEFPDDRLKCRFNKSYENSLFFTQNEKENLISKFTNKDFPPEQRELINQNIDNILIELEKVKLGQQITYDDLLEEIKELKDYYYLSKKPWKHMLIGKLSEMVAGGVISETISHEIVKIVITNY